MLVTNNSLTSATVLRPAETARGGMHKVAHKVHSVHALPTQVSFTLNHTRTGLQWHSGAKNPGRVGNDQSQMALNRVREVTPPCKYTLPQSYKGILHGLCSHYMLYYISYLLLTMLPTRCW